MSAPSNAKRIAALNDHFRVRAGLLESPDTPSPKGLVLFSRGIAAMDFLRQIELLTRVRSFDRFTGDNDPHGEHDFGSIDAPGVGKVFWKIDYYADGACEFGSEDPADPDRSFRVLTIMLAEEY